MKTDKRERVGSWGAEVHRGQWFTVDGRTGRRVKAKSQGHAVQMAAENNTRELSAAATVPAAVVWGK